MIIMQDFVNALKQQQGREIEFRGEKYVLLMPLANDFCMAAKKNAELPAQVFCIGDGPANIEKEEDPDGDTGSGSPEVASPAGDGEQGDAGASGGDTDQDG